MGDNLLLKVLICLVMVICAEQVHGDGVLHGNANRTNVNDTEAVCNDGSPAIYYHDPGFGDGVNNWLILLWGGGWCGSDGGCRGRLGSVGSNIQYPAIENFKQIRSANSTVNPDFYNWNRVEVGYCDSSLFMGSTDHLSINMYGRGARIFDSIMNELLQKGMANAKNAILSGSSAGGLATLLHCDGFRALLPSDSTVKCVSDSGFFVHATKLYGAEKRAETFAKVSAYHGFTDKLVPACTSRMNASLCLFPQYIIKDIQTPLFFIESKFDSFQLNQQHVSDEPGFGNCTKNLTLCTPSHFQNIKDYGMAVAELLQEVREYSSSIGIFVHPCFRHGHFFADDESGWHMSYTMKNKTIAQAVGDWFYDRSCPFQEIDTEHEFPLSEACTPLPNVEALDFL